MPDFLLDHGIKKISRFYEVITSSELKRFYLVLHSLELAFVLWIAIAAMSLGAAWISLAIGFTVHLIIDIIGNPIGVKGYSFFYRMSQGFLSEKLLIKGRKRKR